MNDKVMTSIMFVSAIALSCIAAFYSIAGLVAIFAAAVVPIIVMGSILEVSKLVVASWLYRNWKEVPRLFRLYFTVALIILMTLTSMGIFGFLSKAHLDQAVPTGDVSSKLSLIDEKIKTEKETINEARKTLSQLDSQVDQTLSRTASQTDDSGVARSLAIRKGQSKERKSIYATIEASQAKIAKLNEERQPVASQLRKVEAEVGPIKYIAALIYGDSLDQTLLEKAVRIVILMIVAVFDPLAVLMLVAVNWSLKKRKPEDEIEVKPEGWHQEWVPNAEEWPPYEPNFFEAEEPPKTEWSVGEPPHWGDEEEARMEIIGPNGNEGLHYENVEPEPNPEPEQEKTMGRFQKDLLEKKLKRQREDINSYNSPSKEFNISDPDNTWEH